MRNNIKLIIIAVLCFIIMAILIKQISYYTYYNFQKSNESGVTLIVTDKVVNLLDKRVHKMLIKEINHIIKTAPSPHINKDFEAYSYGGQDVQYWIVNLEDSAANNIIVKINPLVVDGINIKEYIDITILNNNIENKDLSEFLESKILELAKDNK